MHPMYTHRNTIASTLRPTPDAVQRGPDSENRDCRRRTIPSRHAPRRSPHTFRSLPPAASSMARRKPVDLCRLFRRGSFWPSSSMVEPRPWSTGPAAITCRCPGTWRRYSFQNRCDESLYRFGRPFPLPRTPWCGARRSAGLRRGTWSQSGARENRQLIREGCPGLTPGRKFSIQKEAWCDAGPCLPGRHGWCPPQLRQLAVPRNAERCRSSAGGGTARGRFPSGQRGQTVNLLATPSKVRILLSPEGLPLHGAKALLVCGRT